MPKKPSREERRDKPLPMPRYVEPKEPPGPDGRYTPPRIRIKPKKHED